MPSDGIADILIELGVLIVWGILCQLAICSEFIESWFHNKMNDLKNKIKNKR